MAAARIRPRFAFAIGVLLILFAALPASVSADDILTEGFEGDTSGWFGQNYSLDGCPAHTGAHAMKLTSTGGTPGQLAIQIEGYRPEGNYRLTVSAMRLTGSSPVEAHLVWYAADGHQLDTPRFPIAELGSYTTTASDFLDPAQGSARVILTIGLPAGSPGSFCIDDVKLEGPAEQAASTPTPTATLTPLPTSTPPSATATTPPTSTPSPSPTALGAPLIDKELELVAIYRRLSRNQRGALLAVATALLAQQGPPTESS